MGGDRTAASAGRVTRKPVRPESLVGEYRTYTVWLPPEHPEWWGLYHAVTPSVRATLLSPPPTRDGVVRIVVWRIPYGVWAVDVRFFRDWRRQVVAVDGTPLLAVELEGPPGASHTGGDDAVRDRLDELCWVIERLWLATADLAFGSRLRELRSDCLVGPDRWERAEDDVGRADPASPERAPRRSNREPRTTALLLLRPDGATALGAGLTRPERTALDLAVESPWLTATDIRSDIRQGDRALGAVGASRLLDRLRAAGVIAPAATGPDEAMPPARSPKDRGPIRVHRSALHVATQAMLDTLGTRDSRSEFSLRQARGRTRTRASWAASLRDRLRAAGLLTV